MASSLHSGSRSCERSPSVQVSVRISSGSLRRTALIPEPKVLGHSVFRTRTLTPHSHPIRTVNGGRALPCLLLHRAGCSWSTGSAPANDPFVRGQRIIRMFAQGVKANLPQNPSDFEAIPARSPNRDLVSTRMQIARTENRPNATLIRANAASFLAQLPVPTRTRLTVETYELIST